MEIKKIVYNASEYGCILAIVISWSLHKSILWCVIHGFLGWAYVIYYMITK